MSIDWKKISTNDLGTLADRCIYLMLKIGHSKDKEKESLLIKDTVWMLATLTIERSKKESQN